MVLDTRDNIWTEDDGTKLVGFTGSEAPCDYIAVLEERGSGVRHEYRDHWENGQQNLIYMWKSGNYSCDCNRLRFLAAIDAQPPDVDDDEDEDPEDSMPPCGDDAQIILRELRIVSEAQVFDMRGNGSGEVCPTLTKEASGDRPSDYAPMVF